MRVPLQRQDGQAPMPRAARMTPRAVTGPALGCLLVLAMIVGAVLGAFLAAFLSLVFGS